MPPESRHNQAHSLIVEGKFAQAVGLLQRALRQSPRDGEAHRLMSLVLNATGELERALYHAERASAARPRDAGLLTAVGNLRFNLGRTDEAMAEFRKAVEVDPACAEAWEAIADLHFQYARFADAERACREGLSNCSGHSVLSTTLAAVLLNTGRGEESMVLLKELCAARKQDQVAAAALAQTSLYVDGVTPEEILAHHKKFAEVMEELLPRKLNVEVRDRVPERPLRVGLVSADFRRHSVAYFLEPLAANMDRERFRLCFYHTVVNEDEVTARFRACAELWRNVATVPVQDLAGVIAGDAIDILIDLGGHTDASRLAAFHMRPAPVQVSYLGYAATTGLPAMDYRIVDSITDPPGAEAYSTERLVRLDPCFLCYRPAAEALEVAGQSREGKGGITFGSFNVLQKVTDRMLRVWARILDAAPGSKLVLKTQGLNQEPIREMIAERMRRAGLARERFELLPWIPSMRGHFEAYRSVDIALDTYPYNGTTTTCDALLKGVPVVTLAGKHHASRVGASLLSAIGERGLVAATEDEYIAAAVGLARNEGSRRTLRAELGKRLQESVLCDAAGYARRLEEALRGMWRERCGRR